MTKNKSKGNSSGSQTSGARRPQRQRTQVQHYADDDPGTFTKKKKRRRSSNGESVSSESESEEEQRQQKQQHPSSLVAHVASSAAEVTNHAKKRKRPSKIGKNAQLTNNNNNNNNIVSPTTTKINSSTSVSLSNNSKRSLTVPKLQEMPPPAPPKTVMMPHTTSIAPILPLATTCPLARTSLAQQYPVVFGRGLGIPLAPPAPEWNSISNCDFYFPQDYKAMAMPTNHEVEDINAPTKDPPMAPVLKKGPWPVCRVVTSVCAPQNSTYLAVGDSAGFILIYTTGAGRKTMGVLTRLNTTASQREHPRQREVQAKLEHKCRHNAELLDNRSAFWATEKTPNAIQCITWIGNLIVFLTPQEIEAIELTPPASIGSNDDGNAFSISPSQSFGGCQNCRTLWTIPVTTVGPRKANGNMTLLAGGELVGSYLELDRHGNMMLWNTWGVTTATTTTTNTNTTTTTTPRDDEVVVTDQEESKSVDNSSISNDVIAGEDWPLLVLREPKEISANSRDAPEFVKLIPFQRQEEDETSSPVPIKRSPGRPPKKKPKPVKPVAQSELIWKAGMTKCHAAMWHHGHSHKGDLLIVVYSGSIVDGAQNNVKNGSGGTNGDAPQVYLAMLRLTEDYSSDENAAPDSPVPSSKPPQYAKLLQKVAVPIAGSARNVANVPEVTLNQSTKGTYTLVAGPRGVRMYKTENMVCLRVYGEGVSLHGKAMVWKSCFVVDNRLQQQLYQQQEEQMEPSSPRSARKEQSRKKNNSDVDTEDENNSSKGTIMLRQNRQGFVWIEQDNLLASLLDAKDSASVNSNKMMTRRRSFLPRIRASSSADEDDDEEDDESYWLHQVWIVGIPHPFRAPKELTETLYFWQGPEKLPLFTLPLPHQSGGVQSMCPLMTSNDRQRSEGMWLRLMVSTVHGECFELAPSVKSDYPGNMYNPGYFVVRDNVDYIEDEDELDKVMVEAPDEDEESDEEDPVVAGAVNGSGVDGDIDPELAEAIRLSLLESQGKPKSNNGESALSDEDDETVVVKDDFGDDGVDLCIPCEPEPFLREKLLPEFESDNLVDVDTTGRDKSAEDAEFAGEVLSILPQSKNAQDSWEHQKTKLQASDQVTIHQLKIPLLPPNGVDEASAIPQAARLVRGGKRAKPGNLEALLKASIKPELRQYMTERGRVWADGTGGTLQDDAWGDVIADVKESDQHGPDRSSQGDTSATPATRSSDGDSDDEAALSDDRLVRAHVNAHTGDGPAMPSFPVSGDDSNGSTAPSPSAPVMPMATPTIDTTQNGIKSTEVGAMQVAIIELKGYSDSAQQYWCTGTVDIPVTLEDCKLPNHDWTEGDQDQEAALKGDESANSSATRTPANAEGGTPQLSKLRQGEGNCDNVHHARSTMPFAVAGTSETAQRSRCAACLGRMVMHSCGKRALPIDYEAIARAEQERKARDEEERRRLNKEKRRQADAKRREERKKMKEEEKRKKKEKEAELQRIREAGIAEARANQANIGELLGSGSPRCNGSVTVPDVIGDNVALPPFACEAKKVVDEVHFAVAEAWKEHAQKFTSSSALTVEAEPVVTIDMGPPNADAFSALNTMAEAASSHIAPSEPKDDKVNTSFSPTPESVGLSASVVTSSYNSIPESMSASAAQHRVLPVHGFFGPSDAYPQHSQSATLETRGTFSAESAALARRKQILSSYHGLAGASAASTSGMVELPRNLEAGRIIEHDPRGHSFHISPMSNSSHPRFRFSQPIHTNHSFQLPAAGSDPRLASSPGAGAGRGSRPYFGYTLLSSNNFRPKVNLRNYSTPSVVTTQTRPSQQQNSPSERNAVERMNPASVNAASSSLHVEMEYSGPRHPTASYNAATASLSAPPTSTGPVSWDHHAQSILPPPQATTAWPVQPPTQPSQGVGHPFAAAVAGHMAVRGHPSVGVPAAQYQAHAPLRNSTVDASTAQGAAPRTNAAPTISFHQHEEVTTRSQPPQLRNAAQDES